MCPLSLTHSLFLSVPMQLFSPHVMHFVFNERIFFSITDIIVSTVDVIFDMV